MSSHREQDQWRRRFRAGDRRATVSAAELPPNSHGGEEVDVVAYVVLAAFDDLAFLEAVKPEHREF